MSWSLLAGYMVKLAHLLGIFLLSMDIPISRCYMGILGTCGLSPLLLFHVKNHKSNEQTEVESSKTRISKLWLGGQIQATPVLIYKVLLEHTQIHTHHLFRYCLQLLPRGQSGVIMTSTAKLIIYATWSLQRWCPNPVPKCCASVFPQLKFSFT